jgi:histone-lysine N-methyltransferase SETMAR
MEDRHSTGWKISDEVGISGGSANTILTEILGTQRVLANFVPNLLLPEQQNSALRSRRSCWSVPTGTLSSWRLWSLVTSRGCTVTALKRGSSRHSGSIQHPWGLKSTTGSDFFSGYRGVVHHEYAPLGQTVNKEYYQEVLRHLRVAVWHRGPELWDACNWQLPLAHSSHLIQGFPAKQGIPQVRQAPYSPDMAPCDFWLLARFVMAQLHTIPKQEFYKCFQRWKDWAKCEESQGACFEGD